MGVGSVGYLGDGIRRARTQHQMLPTYLFQKPCSPMLSSNGNEPWAAAAGCPVFRAGAEAGFHVQQRSAALCNTPRTRFAQFSVFSRSHVTRTLRGTGPTTTAPGGARQGTCHMPGVRDPTVYSSTARSCPSSRGPACVSEGCSVLHILTR